MELAARLKYVCASSAREAGNKNSADRSSEDISLRDLEQAVLGFFWPQHKHSYSSFVLDLEEPLRLYCLCRPVQLYTLTLTLYRKRYLRTCSTRSCLHVARRHMFDDDTNMKALCSEKCSWSRTDVSRTYLKSRRLAGLEQRMRRSARSAFEIVRSIVALNAICPRANHHRQRGASGDAAATCIHTCTIGCKSAGCFGIRHQEQCVVVRCPAQ